MQIFMSVQALWRVCALLVRGKGQTLSSNNQKAGQGVGGSQSRGNRKLLVK